MLCTHAGAAPAALEASVPDALVQVISNDENICAVGYAMDALNRLGMHEPRAAAMLRAAMAETSLFPSDTMSRPCGIDNEQWRAASQAAARFADAQMPKKLPYNFAQNM